MMPDEFDDIFEMFDKIFKEMMSGTRYSNSNIFPWMNTSNYVHDRNVIRSKSMAHREEIFNYDTEVIVVIEIGHEIEKTDIHVDVLENDGRRILEVKSPLTGTSLLRRYALTSNMTGEVDWTFSNGILEIRLKVTPEVVELD